MSHTYGGSRPSQGKPVKSYSERRECSHPECTTRLSRYNPDDTCGVHTESSNLLLQRRRFPDAGQAS